MFEKRKSTLISRPEKKKNRIDTNQPTFVKAAVKATSVTTTGNGALTYSTSGNPFVDQFTSFSSYLKPRTYAEVDKDMNSLWTINPVMATRMAFAIRMITRDTIVENNKYHAKGAELKNEGIYRMMWIGINHPNIFKAYLPLFIMCGSWKDVFTMLREDIMFHGWEGRKLDWNYIGNIIISGLKFTSQSELVKKYMPHIKSIKNQTSVRSQANTIIGKWIASLLFEKYTYREYRKVKSSGTAHIWQQQISKQEFDLIDFYTIHGKALKNLVQSKFLKNQGLSEKFTKWIEKPEVQDKGVKTTSFVFEIFKNLTISTPEYQRLTIDAQFKTLLDKAISGKEEFSTNWMVVRDISGSMGSTVPGANMSAGNIAKSLALFFSQMLTGKFANSYMVFASNVAIRNWKGNTPSEKWINDTEDFYGSTRFQSVIDLMVSLKHQGIVEEDFPNGLLLLSDMEFNPTHVSKTNIQVAYDKLINAGFSKEFIDKFIIVMWNIQGNYHGVCKQSKPNFDAHDGQKNVFYFSGFSPSIIQFLNGSKIKTPIDLVQEFLDQPILQLIEF